MKFIERPLYTDKMIRYKSNGKIKILTGIRGVGKSYLLRDFKLKLPSDKVIYIDFESLEYSFINDSVSLYDLLTNKISQSNLIYLLLDEIQRVNDWQKVILALKMDFNVDIYIAVSRANIDELPDDQISLIEVFPFSFNESQCQSLENYLSFNEVYYSTNNFYSTLAQDVLLVNKIADNALMLELLKLLVKEAGNIHSFNSLSKLLGAVVGKAPSVRTVEAYIKMLTQANIIYSVPVFDFKENYTLNRYSKYYPVNLNLYSLFKSKININDLYVIETLVYFELRRLNAKVLTSKNVSFIAETADNKIYIQISGRQWKRRSIIKPINTIKDHFSKWIVTSAKIYTNSSEGIRVINLYDFLRGE